MSILLSKTAGIPVVGCPPVAAAPNGYTDPFETDTGGGTWLTNPVLVGTPNAVAGAIPTLPSQPKMQAFQAVITFTAGFMPIVFPTAFAFATIGVWATLNDDPGVSIAPEMQNITLTGFNIRLYTNTNAQVATGAFRLAFFAIGF